MSYNYKEDFNAWAYSVWAETGLEPTDAQCEDFRMGAVDDIYDRADQLRKEEREKRTKKGEE